MSIELDNTSIIINVNNETTFEVDFVKSSGVYNGIDYDAQWTYSSTDASVYHLGNVGIGTTPSITNILNVHNGINFTGELYLNNILISTPPKYSSSWTYTDDGNVYYIGGIVGIGTDEPISKLDVNGIINGTSKSFKIEHPFIKDKILYHGNIECPRYDNLYRGCSTIVNGTCVVNIDKECNDTNGLIVGTFDALNTDSQLYLQNNKTFDNVKGTIENGKIHIECDNTKEEITIYWIVIAERKDIDVVNLNNTDSNGKMICEYFK